MMRNLFACAILFLFTSSLVEVSGNVAKVGANEFASLQLAMDAAKDGDTVRMLSDYTITASINISKAITLDLNGCSIIGAATSSYGRVFQILESGGNLTITDTGDGGGAITSTQRNKNLILIVVSGKLSLKSGRLEYAQSTQNGCCIVQVSRSGKLLIDGGKVSTSQSYGGGTITNYGSCEVNGGEIINNLEVSGENYKATACAITSSGSLIIRGGRLASKQYAVYDGNSSTVIMSKAVIEGDIMGCGEYVLEDTCALDVAHSFVAAKVSYSRDSHNVFGTICLPFVPDIDENITYYRLESIDNEANTVNLAEVGYSDLKACTPYIYYSRNGVLSVSAQNVTLSSESSPEADDGDRWSLKGVFAPTAVFDSENDVDYNSTNGHKVVDASAYYIKNNAFRSIYGYFRLNAYRAYISSSAPIGSKNFEIALLDELTSISGAQCYDQEPMDIYDLNGVRLEALRHGINVVRSHGGRARLIQVR